MIIKLKKLLMIFWNIEKLLKKLSSQELTQKELFFYFFGLTFLETIVSSPFLSEESYLSSIFEWFDWGIFLFCSLISLGVCFIANGGNKGKKFIERYISIQFVMTIRYSVFIIFAALVVSLCGFDFENDKTSFIFSIVCYLIITFKEISNFKYLVNITDENY